MKILVLPSFYPDSSDANLGSFFKEQVKTLAQFGIEVNVVYVEQKSLRKLSFKNLLIRYFQKEVTIESKHREYRIKGWHLPGRIGIFFWVLLSERLIKKFILENGKPDLIHAHNVFWAGVTASRISKKFKIPFIITEHSSVFLEKNVSIRKRSIAKRVFLSASEVISVSQSLRKAINEILPNLSIEIIPNLVDTNFFKPDDQRQKSNETTNFLSIGNLYKIKGHEILIDAFFEVLKINENITLSICGDGPEKKRLLEKIDALNLEGQIQLLGHLPKGQILKYLQTSDCLVLPSYYETFGVVLIEALAVGIPFIATISGGPEDIIENGVGLIIEPGKASLLAEAMISFINQKDKFSKSKIRSIALEKYSRKTIFQKLMRVYSAVLLKSGSVSISLSESIASSL